MANEELKYRLGLDASQFTGGMKAAQREVASLDRAAQSNHLGHLSGELQLAGGRAATFSGHAFRAQQASRSFFDELRSGTGNLGSVSAAFTGATVAATSFYAVTQSAKGVLGDYAPYDSMVRGLLSIEGGSEATEARIAKLRKTAMQPGLGFDQVVQGDIRLRSAGLTAELSERSIAAMGNALATVGKGKTDLDGVILALGQIQSKGKVSAEEINQIAERVPQIRLAMKGAFGTADTEALQKMGISSQQFIAGIVTELEKLPKLSGGARKSLEDYDDAWDRLKTTVAETGAGIAGNWVDDVARGFNGATKLVEAFNKKFGIRNSALDSADRMGATSSTAEAEAAAAEQLKIDQEEANDRQALHLANLDYATKLDAERTANEAKQAKLREEQDKASLRRVAEAQDRVNRAMMTEEEYLQKRIADYRKVVGPDPAAFVNREQDPTRNATAADTVAKLVELRKQLADLQERSVEAGNREAEAADRQTRAAYDDAMKQTAAREAAQKGFATELQILEARASGNDRLADSLQRQADLEALKNQLMKDQSLSAEAATRLAERKLKADDAISKRGERSERGSRLYNAEESAQRRAQRSSERNRTGFTGLLGQDNTTRLGLAARAREATQGAAAAATTSTRTPDKGKGDELLKKIGGTLDNINQSLGSLGIAR